MRRGGLWCVRFIVKNKSFTQQFSHVYNKRLLGLKAAVHRAAEERWGGGGGAANSSGEGGVKFVDRLVNMKEGDEWVVIGTTYKVNKGKHVRARMYVTMHTCAPEVLFFCAQQGL